MAAPFSVLTRLRRIPRRFIGLGLGLILGWGSEPARAQQTEPSSAEPTLSAGAMIQTTAVDPTISATPENLSVDTASREEVRLFYRAIYAASEGIPIGWTGDYDATFPLVAAGDTAAALKDAVNLRVNFFRALAGVPADITLNPAYNAKAQLAALMMSANDTVRHIDIPPSWTFYSAGGAEAAALSNLALGVMGPAAVDGYVADPGASNAAAGHRRELFHPQTLEMGTGDVPGDDDDLAANALWVVDGSSGDVRPYVRESFVAWPPPGYVPYRVVYPRWSLSFPRADFSGSTVTMSRDGTSIPVRLEPVMNGFGENTLVWVYDHQDSNSMAPHVRPDADTAYHVAVDNVVINGAPQNFSYDVIVFDPDVEGPDTIPVTVVGPEMLDLGRPHEYAVDGLFHATGYQWRRLTRSAYRTVQGAEAGTNGLGVRHTGSYDVITDANPASGSHSFHLAHPTPDPQWVQLGTLFLGTASAELSFQTQLRRATAGEVARVQVSTDDGANWTDVYTQAGSGREEETYTARTVRLSQLDGRTFAVRFAYTFGEGTYYPGSDAGVGWFFDDIVLTGVSAVNVAGASATFTGNTFTFTPTSTGTAMLQARGVYYDFYPLDWGPIKTVTVTGIADGTQLP